MREKELCVF